MVELDLFRLETKKKPKLDYASYTPTLFDVARWFDNIENVIKGGTLSLVGERESALTTFCAYVMRRKSVYIRSYAGSGKTMIAEAVVSTIPRHRMHAVDNGSEKAIWYEEDALNAADYVYIGELQKVKSDTIEVLKSWGEGRAATRAVPDVAATAAAGRAISRTTHLDVKPTLVTQAWENKEAGNVNDEFLRRFFDLRTDPSAEQTRRVKMSKLNRRANPWADLGLPPQDTALLLAHVEAAMDVPIKGYAMPGIDAEGGFESYIPEDYVISRSYVDHFLDLAEGVARFYHYDRLVHDNYLLVTPEDVYAAIVLQGPQLRLSCFRLDAEDTAIMEALPAIQPDVTGALRATAKDKKTESQVMATLASMGLNLERGKIRERLTKLATLSPYVEVDRDTTPHRYYRAPGLSGDFDAEVDWGRLVDEMAKGAVSTLPANVAQAYVARYCGDQVIVTHPMTGEHVDLRAVKVTDDKPTSPKGQPKRTGGLLDYN